MEPRPLVAISAAPVLLPSNTTSTSTSTKVQFPVFCFFKAAKSDFWVSVKKKKTATRSVPFVWGGWRKLLAASGARHAFPWDHLEEAERCRFLRSGGASDFEVAAIL